MADTKPFQVLHGDALVLLRQMVSGSVDAIITDPPYASGSMSMSQKSKSSGNKYTDCGSKKSPYPDFPGDALSQRAWASFMHEILVECRRVTRKHGVAAIFTDWRQLPALTDALQWAGWTWRGVAVWDKVSSRPQKGRFRQQAEYIVWGSNGAMPVDRKAPVLSGVFSHANVATRNRFHQTQKPLDLMRQVVRICEEGGHILDPFAGSGSTLEAALLEGYAATGIELEEHNVEIIRKRIVGAQGSLILPGSGASLEGDNFTR